MKRFWKEVSVAREEGGWGIRLDGRPVRTPGRVALAVPAESLAEAMATEHPERYVATMSKAKRKGKIFLDYLRNDRMSTAVAALSHQHERAFSASLRSPSWQCTGAASRRPGA